MTYESTPFERLRNLQDVWGHTVKTKSEMWKKVKRTIQLTQLFFPASFYTAAFNVKIRNIYMGKVRTEEGPVNVGVRWVCVAF